MYSSSFSLEMLNSVSFALVAKNRLLRMARTSRDAKTATARMAAMRKKRLRKLVGRAGVKEREDLLVLAGCVRSCD